MALNDWHPKDELLKKDNICQDELSGQAPQSFFSYMLQAICGRQTHFLKQTRLQMSSPYCKTPITLDSWHVHPLG